MAMDNQKGADIELAAVSHAPQNGLSNDDADMRRMGKKQQFQRNFEFVSIAAFSVVAIAGWIYVPSSSTTTIANGQTGGLIVMFLVNWFGLGFVVLSLAEMSSMAPTAGGQYHWASEFAAPSMQKLISYFAGCLSTISWLAGLASAMFLTGFTIQGLIVVNVPSYVPKPYQEYLFAIILPTIGLVANTLFARILPRLEWLMFGFFSLAFVAIIIALWVVSPRLTAAEVFQTIEGGGGWSSLGLNLLPAQSAIMFLIVGSDATAHMAEETRDASTTVPRAMITSYMVNAGLSFVMIVTYCFVLTDFDGAYNSPVGLFGLPSVQVIVDAVGLGGGTAIQAIFIIIAVFSCTNWMASSARQVFAFARDHGFPFGSIIAKVNRNGTSPANALIFAWFFVVLINLISLGSVVAFDAITSLQILALMFTYLISVSCIIWRRLFGGPLPPAPWTLGRFGLPVNIVAWCYCIYLIIFLPWPVEMPVTPENFNWASVMFAGIMALSAVYYVVYARKVYQGPVVHVKRLEEF